MKKIFFILGCVLFFSCRMQEQKYRPFIAVYQSYYVGNTLPSYIILKEQPKYFEIYSPSVYGSVFGQWRINHDTLFLLPKYETFIEKAEQIISEVTQQNMNVMTIPQKYLIKNDCLIDVTDYRSVLPDLCNDECNKEVYKRLEIKLRR